MFSVQGRTAVLVHARFGTHATPTPGADEVLASLRDDGVDKVLVIGNAPEALLMASYGRLLGDLYQIPQGGGSLAYSVLTVTLVFKEFQDRLRWKYVNYLWDDPGRPPARLRP